MPSTSSPHAPLAPPAATPVGLSSLPAASSPPSTVPSLSPRHEDLFAALIKLDFNLRALAQAHNLSALELLDFTNDPAVRRASAVLGNFTAFLAPMVRAAERRTALEALTNTLHTATDPREVRLAAAAILNYGRPRSNSPGRRGKRRPGLGEGAATRPATPDARVPGAASVGGSEPVPVRSAPAIESPSVSPGVPAPHHLQPNPNRPMPALPAPACTRTPRIPAPTPTPPFRRFESHQRRRPHHIARPRSYPGHQPLSSRGSSIVPCSHRAPPPLLAVLDSG